MQSSQAIESFAELGRLFRQYRQNSTAIAADVSFADAIAVTDREVLRDVQEILEEQTGDLEDD